MLTAGSVSVDFEGVATGDGLALELYIAELAVSAATPAIYTAIYGKEVGTEAKGSLFEKSVAAVRSTALATAIVSYLTANTEVSVTGVEAGGDTAPGTIT